MIAQRSQYFRLIISGIPEKKYIYMVGNLVNISIVYLVNFLSIKIQQWKRHMECIYYLSIIFLRYELSVTSKSFPMFSVIKEKTHVQLYWCNRECRQLIWEEHRGEGRTSPGHYLPICRPKWPGVLPKRASLF